MLGNHAQAKLMLSEVCPEYDAMLRESFAARSTTLSLADYKAEKARMKDVMH
jgi:hypothetical protein